MEGRIKSGEVIVGAPVPDLGENRYLTHFTSEILVDGEVAGYVLFTRYAYARAARDRMPIQWMVKPDSYMAIVQDMLINPEARCTSLPLSVQESINDTNGTVVILDEITCSPDLFAKEIYSEAIKQIVSYFSDRTDGLLINEPRPLARYLNGIYTDPVSFWGKFGIYQVDSKNFLYSADQFHKNDRVATKAE